MADLNMSIILVASASRAVHFVAWTWSLDHTSLALTALFVTSHPIVIVSFMVIMTKVDWS